MLEMGINTIEWPSLQYCTMSAFGGDALQRKAMSHKSSFIIIDSVMLSASSMTCHGNALKIVIFIIINRKIIVL